MYQTNPITYIKKSIDIKYNHQEPGDIACLDNQTCVIKFKTACLIVDLSIDNNKQPQIFEFRKHKIFLGKLFPLKNGDFVIYDGSDIFLINKNLQVSKVQNISEFSYFHDSSNLFISKDKQWKQLKNSTQQSIIQNKDKVKNKSISNNQINMTQHSPKQQIDIMNIKINEILTNAKKDNNYFYGQFITLNKQMSLAVFFDGVNLNIYNYKQGVLMWSHQISSFKYQLPNMKLNLGQRINLSKKFSSDLKHYVELQKRGYSNKIAYYKQIKTKKIYFHLMSKSGLILKYGQEIALKVFKVLMI